MRGESRRHREFGVASSHLVLAIEEAQKAVSLALFFAGASADEIELRNILSHHGTRHAQALWGAFVSLNMDIMLRQWKRVDEQYAASDVKPEVRRKDWLEGVIEESLNPSNT